MSITADGLGAVFDVPSDLLKMFLAGIFLSSKVSVLFYCLLEFIVNFFFILSNFLQLFVFELKQMDQRMVSI